MRDSSKPILIAALLVSASAIAAPPTSQGKPGALPEDPALIEHPPELTPEARQRLEDHCAKQHDACAPTTPETEQSKRDAAPKKPKR